MSRVALYIKLKGHHVKSDNYDEKRHHRYNVVLMQSLVSMFGSQLYHTDP